MEHIIASLHGFRHCGTVADIPLDELHVKPVQIMPVSGTQIVQHADLGFSVEILCDMTADKTGTACNQDSHKLPTSLTSAFMRSICCSMDSTNAIWVRARSRL